MSPSPAQAKAKSVGGNAPEERRCTAFSRRTGQQCGNWAMTGLTVCRFHGGSLPSNRAKNIAAKLTRQIGGGQLDVEPTEVILEQVRGAAWNVEQLRDYVAELELEVREDGAVALPERVVEFGEHGGAVRPAALHVLVEFYNSERERLVKWSKVAIDAGIEERRVRLAESQAQRMGAALAKAVEKTGLNEDQIVKLKTNLAHELRLLTAGGSE